MTHHPNHTSTHNNQEQRFILGDRWLYYKIYTGFTTSDHILTDIIGPVALRLLKKKRIDKWFFIRYADPKHHIRVRFHCTDSGHVQAVIDSLYPELKKYIDQDLIWKIQTDTYQRELKRYGHALIDQSETLFFHDSKMIVKFLSIIEGEAGEKIRWLFSMRAIDQILNDFKYKYVEKLNLLEHLKTGFGKEFGMDKSLKVQLDKKFRKEHDNIRNFMNLNAETHQEYAIIIDMLKKKSNNGKSCLDTILAHTDQSKRNDMASSHIHMFMNRLFRSKNRLHEMVIYQLLYRFYKAELGRRKFDSKSHRLA